ncbi:hypothetical protein IMPR6_20276 [Imperialibacter sp. EC-SDR9]|nr:hypothetical protein IMPERIA75_420011 [Imperialibacter sp. 75]CAD5293824.1 hypothetical protein IMPERIA89_660010 [Imperialibacter sp. 89]VVT12800.1 hypothetical protein IMPR6_20276 [Imperialibacter sp. EC-SDR9]
MDIGTNEISRRQKVPIKGGYPNSHTNTTISCQKATKISVITTIRIELIDDPGNELKYLCRVENNKDDTYGNKDDW